MLWVTAADKLSNTTTLLAHVAIHGDRTWELFGGGRDGSLWYYRSMSDLVSKRLDGSRLPGRLAAAVDELTGRGG